MAGTVFRTWESPDPERLSRRAREATDAARSANETTRSVLVHLTHALVAGKPLEKLVRAGELALEANGSASSASEAAREAVRAAQTGDAAQLDSAADRAQDEVGNASVLADQAMSLIP